MTSSSRSRSRSRPSASNASPSRRNTTASRYEASRSARRERALGVTLVDDRAKVRDEQRYIRRRGHSGGETPLSSPAHAVEAHTQSTAPVGCAPHRLRQHADPIVVGRIRAGGLVRIEVVSAHCRETTVEHGLSDEKIGDLLVQRDHLLEQGTRSSRPPARSGDA